jgi:hypothetical protein
MSRVSITQKLVDTFMHSKAKFHKTCLRFAVEVRHASHVDFPPRADWPHTPAIPALFRIRFHKNNIIYFVSGLVHPQLKHLLFTHHINLQPIFHFSHYVLPTRRAEPELGHLGLRRGSIPKWSGHPHSALSGAANISLCLCIVPGLLGEVRF